MWVKSMDRDMIAWIHVGKTLEGLGQAPDRAEKMKMIDMIDTTLLTTNFKMDYCILYI